MSNPLFQQMNMGVGGNHTSSLMQRFQQFQQMFKGDPLQQIQNLLNSGKVSQSQYNQAVQMAQQFQKLIGSK